MARAPRSRRLSGGMAARRNRRRRPRAQRTRRRAAARARRRGRLRVGCGRRPSSRRRPSELARRRRRRAARRARPRAHRAGVARRRQPGCAARRAAARGRARGRRRRSSARSRSALRFLARPARTSRSPARTARRRRPRSPAICSKALGRRRGDRGEHRHAARRARAVATPPDWIALEVSSFQLHDTPSIEPTVGMLTNLSANHLDRYDERRGVLRRQGAAVPERDGASRWVTNADDPDVAGDGRAASPGMHCRFSVRRRARRLLRSREPTCWWCSASRSSRATSCRCSATTTSRTRWPRRSPSCWPIASIATPMRARSIADALRDVQRARASDRDRRPSVDGVTWINDSKSTNVASTLVAMQGMTQADRAAARRQAQGRAVHGAGRRAAADGQRGDRVWRGGARSSSTISTGVVPLTRLGSSFDDVSPRRATLAQPGDVVLLSPACSSYDMFDNYEQRGAVFKQLAAELA